MKSFEIFVSNNGYSFVNGELLEVRIDTYAYQENGSIDICVLHREKEYWVPADNFYLSVDDYERNIRPEITMQYLACWVNYDNPKERTTWVIKNNQPVKVVVDPLELFVHVDNVHQWRHDTHVSASKVAWYAGYRLVHRFARCYQHIQHDYHAILFQLYSGGNA